MIQQIISILRHFNCYSCSKPTSRPPSLLLKRYCNFHTFILYCFMSIESRCNKIWSIIEDTEFFSFTLHSFTPISWTAHFALHINLMKLVWLVWVEHRKSNNNECKWWKKKKNDCNLYSTSFMCNKYFISFHWNDFAHVLSWLESLFLSLFSRSLLVWFSSNAFILL